MSPKASRFLVIYFMSSLYRNCALLKVIAMKECFCRLVSSIRMVLHSYRKSSDSKKCPFVMSFNFT